MAPALNFQVAELQREERQERQARAYQLEMFHAGSQENIVVVMPTGTGKTEIAILRIREELSREPNKLIWFLCPTIALCEQQAGYINMSIPLIQVRSFTGNDQVHRWENMETWKMALRGVHVAVSTFQVLYDALSNAFIKIGSLSLLIFDEAHHCIGNSPANNIMTEIYHRERKKGASNVPKILGLSASPVLTDASTLKKLEQNLAGICRAPDRHYDELMSFTNRPEIRITCILNPKCEMDNMPKLLLLLQGLVSPSIGFLHTLGTTGSRLATNPVKQPRPITKFITTAKAINLEIGRWGAGEYMRRSIVHFKQHMRENAEKNWTTDKKTDVVMELLCGLGPIERNSPEIGAQDVSPKCRFLLETLQHSHGPDFCGLVFVTRRASVVALKNVIENHPRTKDLFKCGTFVGMSNVFTTTQLGDLHDIRSQAETLKKFKERKINLIVTTDALEEGIDVTACNTIISYDKPGNLKSFIQRRGRARKHSARCIILVDNKGDQVRVEDFRRQEAELVTKYRDQTRVREEYEEQHEDPRLYMTVESTGAHLTMNNAISHLYNFCSKLPSQPFVDNMPIFTYKDHKDDRISARVTLPTNLDPSLHSICSSRSWPGKKQAKADAAVQAYRALHAFGLINDNLVPVELKDMFDKECFSAGHYTIEPQYDPWGEIVGLWDLGTTLYSHEMRIIRPGMDDVKFVMIIPLQLGITIQFHLFITPTVTFEVAVSAGTAVTVEDLTSYRDAARLILQSVHSSVCASSQNDYAFLFLPVTALNETREFLETYTGSSDFSVAINRNLSSSPGLIRPMDNIGRPLVMDSWPLDIPRGAEEPQEAGILCEKVSPLTRRRNFLLPWTTDETSRLTENLSAGSSHITLPHVAGRYVIDNLPFSISQIALYIPSITHEIGKYLVARQLWRHLSPHDTFARMDLLAIAVSPNCAESRGEFRTLAFLGMTVLRLAISKQLFLHHTGWHEGLLSGLAQVILSDAGLARAAFKSGLGQFLITKRFNGRQWKPTFISQPNTTGLSQGMRSVGVGLLADMVKAIVGAVYVSSGVAEASRLAASMVAPIKKWNETSFHDGTYRATRPSASTSNVVRLTDLEELVGHHFQDTSLLAESMTHPSYPGLSQTTSYRRLAFLGDSVLQMIVVHNLYHRANITRTDKLQSMKSALTNNMLLSYLALQSHRASDEDEQCLRAATFATSTGETHSTPLWEFLRWFDPHLTRILAEISSRDHSAIDHGLWEKPNYPWLELTSLETASVLSDIVQAMFGAIFVDCKASLDHCQTLAERLQIIGLLDRFVCDKVVLEHPRYILQSLFHSKISYRISKGVDGGDKYVRCIVYNDGAEIVDIKGDRSSTVLVQAFTIATSKLDKDRTKLT